MPHFSLDLSFTEIVVNIIVALLLILVLAIVGLIIRKGRRNGSITLENIDKLATILLKFAIIGGIGIIGASYYLQSQNGRYQMIPAAYSSDVFIIDTRTGITHSDTPQ